MAMAIFLWRFPLAPDQSIATKRVNMGGSAVIASRVSGAAIQSRAGLDRHVASLLAMTRCWPRHFLFRAFGGGLAAGQSRDRSIIARARSGSLLSKRISTAAQPS